MVPRLSFVFIGILCVSAFQENDLKKDVKEAAAKLKEVGENISKLLGLEKNPINDDLVRLIETQTLQFAKEAEKVQKQLEAEVKNIAKTPMNENFNRLSKAIKDTVDSFRKKLDAAGVTQKATELQGKLQNGLGKLIEESKNLAIKLEPQMSDASRGLEKIAKKVLEDAVKNLDQLQKKLKEAGKTK